MYIIDGLINLEFIGHPHSNKKDEDWLLTFKKLGLRVLGRKKRRFDRIFLSSVYHLEKE